jgi:hypothetical protein
LNASCVSGLAPRLVLKERFLNIERFLSYLTFYPPKNVAAPLIRVEKNFFKIVLKGYLKKQNFHRFQKCAEVLNLAQEKQNFTEKPIFWDLAKKRFLRKNL